MGSCAPEAREGCCLNQRKTESARCKRSKSQPKRGHLQIVLQPLQNVEPLKRATKTIASTRDTARKQPTIIQAIDQYIYENQGLESDKSVQGERIRMTDSILIRNQMDCDLSAIQNKIKHKYNCDDISACSSQIQPKPIQRKKSLQKVEKEKIKPQKARRPIPSSYIHI